MPRKRIRLPIIVEGRYDKITLSSYFDCRVFTSEGFGIFNSKEKQALLRKVACDGIIVLTDSDGGGKQIRSFLNSIIPKDKIYNLYIPDIAGKERRKSKPSRAGYLGVEGMSREVLEMTLAPFIDDGGRVEEDANRSAENPRKMITKVDFFEDGLSGGDCSSQRREQLAIYFGLPHGMTAKALLEALNIISDLDAYKSAVAELFPK